MSDLDRPARPRVAVVFGGRSSEHAISCVTAGSVLAAIDPDRYDVVPIGISKEGRWVLESGQVERLAIGGAGALPSVDGDRMSVMVVGEDTGAELRPTGGDRDGTSGIRDLGGIDVVLPLLHGPFGEDGTVQGLLEMADVRYVGSGVLASSVGMDKHYMKVVLAAAGLPMTPSVVITERDWLVDRAGCRDRVLALGLADGQPVFVKPCRGGSSIGISKVGIPDQLDAAVDEARQWDPKVIVEASAGVGARELECGVLEERDGPRASVVGEITVTGDREFYDFAAKYLPGDVTRLDVPADLPADVSEQVRALSLAAFEALSCEGLARVDFFWTTDGRVVVNEINTMPGFTPTSMYPRLWEASGVDYASLVETLLEVALARRTGLR